MRATRAWQDHGREHLLGSAFPREVMLWVVRWHCRYGLSYRGLEEMMTERGAPVDHTTVYRWVQKYAPKLDKQKRSHPQV